MTRQKTIQTHSLTHLYLLQHLHTLNSNILEAMLYAGNKVWNEAVDASFVSQSSGDSLCDLYLVAFAKKETQSQLLRQ